MVATASTEHSSSRSWQASDHFQQFESTPVLVAKDNDKDQTSKDKDQDKDCILDLKESIRTRTRTNITAWRSFPAHRSRSGAPQITASRPRSRRYVISGTDLATWPHIRLRWMTRVSVSITISCVKHHIAVVTPLGQLFSRSTDVNWPSFGKGENKSQLIDIDPQPYQTMYQNKTI